MWKRRRSQWKSVHTQVWSNLRRWGRENQRLSTGYPVMTQYTRLWKVKPFPKCSSLSKFILFVHNTAARVFQHLLGSNHYDLIDCLVKKTIRCLPFLLHSHPTAYPLLRLKTSLQVQYYVASVSVRNRGLWQIDCGVKCVLHPDPIHQVCLMRVYQV